MKQSAWHRLPEAFIERLHKFIPASDIEDVLESFCHIRPSTFRANTLKISSNDLENELKERGFHIQRVPWYKDAFILVDQPQRLLMETEYYTSGSLYLQSLSSMIPPLVMNPQLDQLIGDIAAAPGSKTTQIAAMMHNTGTIVANDKSRIRLYKLEANLKMQGITNVQTTCMAGQEFWYHYPEYFDSVLVDVPCSMDGRIQVDDPESYEHWSTKKIKELVQIQRFLLRAAISATKPGGTIVYSTCTLAPEENEGVIDWIMQKEGDVLEVMDISLDIEGRRPGIEGWKEKLFTDVLKKTIRILPSATMEGFYVAKLRKLTSNIPASHSNMR